MRSVVYPRRTRIPGRVDDVGTFSPDSISDLILWLDANQLVGLNDNDPISTWTDSSPEHNNATASGSLRPLYKTNIVNGKPVVRFDGTDDVMVTGSALPGGTDGLAIFIVMNTNDNSQRSMIGWGNESANEFVGFKIGATDTYLEYYWWANDLVWDSANIQTATWYYLGAMYDGTNKSIRRNGTESSPQVASRNTASTVANIGNASSGDTTFYGDIAEILVYDKAVSVSDIENLEDYFRAKYGLA